MTTKEKEKPEDAPSPPPEKILYDNRIKRKNVLALNEKVAAIREYEKMPVYKRIGRMFHCSPDQIKRIVLQKDSILKAWEQRTRRCQDAKTLEMKVVRVSMLGKAVYDWIRRMMYYKDFMISDGLIQKMALQFKSAMGLQNFFPHQDWCDKFRQTYKISENDSKLLKIGYTQGHSVQIKDVIKDVLSECTPDVAEREEDDEEEEPDKNENGSDTAAPRVTQPDKRLMLKPCISVRKPSELSARAMPQLQPIRQLVALPIKSNGVGLPQKVLVATPITQAGTTGQRAGTAPMTMTIIPLTTIAQTQKQQNNAPQDKPPTVPPPIVAIKQEIKDEPEEVVRIKQECISDDEEEVLEEATTTQQSVANAQEAAISKTPGEQPPLPKNNTSAIDDYEDLALASLRKLIQTHSGASSNTVTATTATTTTTTTPPTTAAAVVAARYKAAIAPPTTTTTTTTTTVVQPTAREAEPTVDTAVASASPTPPMPPLTRAPAMSRMTHKRKHRVDDNTPTLPPIKSCAEARKYLKLLEDFALTKENYRLIGLVTRADEVLREMDGNEDVDVD